MNVKYRSKRELQILIHNKTFTLPEGSIVTVTRRNGNKSVLVHFGEDDIDWLNASWFINNFEGVPL
jgi:hypothetical protein